MAAEPKKIQWKMASGNFVDSDVLEINYLAVGSWLDMLTTMIYVVGVSCGILLMVKTISESTLVDANQDLVLLFHHSSQMLSRVDLTQSVS